MDAAPSDVVFCDVDGGVCDAAADWDSVTCRWRDGAGRVVRVRYEVRPGRARRPAGQPDR